MRKPQCRFGREVAHIATAGEIVAGNALCEAPPVLVSSGTDRTLFRLKKRKGRERRMGSRTHSKIDFGDLEAFSVMATELNFTAASEKLNISPSALSRRIQKVETFLNTKLFLRTTRHVQLTPVGKELLVRTLELTKSFDEMVLALEERYHAPASRVVVACVPSATAPTLGAFQQFTREHSKVQLSIADSTGNDVLEAVLSREADFGITYLGQNDPSLEFIPILHDTFVVATRPDGMLAKRSTVRWDELGDEPIATAWRGAGIRLLMNRELARHQVSFECSYEVQHIATAIDLVNAGVGIAVVPQLVLDRHNTKDLKGIPLVHPSVSRSLGLVRLKSQRPTKPAGRLWNLLKALRPADEPEIAQAEDTGSGSAAHEWGGEAYHAVIG
jgi:DNA-binding transcriptional LysR family regulator